jgi:hypothetical protein
MSTATKKGDTFQGEWTWLDALNLIPLLASFTKYSLEALLYPERAF